MAPTSSILLWDFNRVGREHYSGIINFPSNKSLTNYHLKLSNSSTSSIKKNLTHVRLRAELTHFNSICRVRFSPLFD